MEEDLRTDSLPALSTHFQGCTGSIVNAMSLGRWGQCQHFQLCDRTFNHPVTIAAMLDVLFSSEKVIPKIFMQNRDSE